VNAREVRPTLEARPEREKLSFREIGSWGDVRYRVIRSEKVDHARREEAQ
jgi:hypothetical protein